MPLGAGRCPAGTSAAGYGVPDAGTSPTNALFPDQRTGLPQTGRLINPSTGDYVFTADGRTQGTSTAAQLVYLAIKTARGSAAMSPSSLAPLGLDLSKASEQGPDFERQISAAFSAALAPIVKMGIITIIGLTWQPVDNQDAAAPLLKWKDRTTGGQFFTNTSGQTFNANTVVGP